MSKKLIAVFLFLALTLTGLAGCGNKTGGEGANPTNDVEGIAPTETVNYENTKNSLEGQIKFAYPVSDGVAMIEAEGFVRWFIDNTGKKMWNVQETLPERTSVEKEFFVNGLCMVKDNSVNPSRATMAVDKKGDVIISAEKQGFTGICSLYSDIPQHSSLQDGYLVAYKTDESYAGVSMKIGVLDTKGYWVIPLSEDNPISRTVKDSGSIYNEPTYLYLGEGLVMITDTRMGVSSFILNIKTNRWIDDSFNINHFHGIFMENGVMISAAGNAKVTASGQVSELDVAMEGIYSSGLFLGIKGGGLPWRGYPETFGYYDANGNRVIDMTQYHESIKDHGFHGDKALIEITNSNGNTYFTLINRQGEFAFEPIDLGGAALASHSVTYSEGILIHRTREEFVFYDEAGKQMFTIPNVSNAIGDLAKQRMSDFSEGLAVVKENDSIGGIIGSYYIDKTGNRVIG